MQQVKLFFKRISLILAISCVVLFSTNVGNASADVIPGSWVEFTSSFDTKWVYSKSSTISFHSYCVSNSPSTVWVRAIVYKNGGYRFSEWRNLKCGYWNGGREADKYDHEYFTASIGYWHQFEVKQIETSHTGVNYEIHN
ncbi:hypothetical protein H9I32_15060 [Bacillus sp. Xin]|uniref:hypothetical protein n=1 Tax=unclassified Bacillus (in: firmicutes) TaxID=185979 RepID=UPI001572ABA8|nr:MULTISPECIES: hypothetical protein [unclassified Bacillus (in: firmicutes)]MBC6973632.1 hypothetical protein [Bacillus sp. Xin]NSW39275.1 hypothetical protein [Bacillus sp. Xin1]